MKSSGTSCAKCKAEMPDDVAGQPRVHCPSCGATARALEANISDGIVVYDGHRVKAKRPSFPSDKKLRFDTYSGVEQSHEYDKLVRVQRTIDKDGDFYSEKVIDLNTGEVLHQCEEPLSQHTNHGSAKPRNK